MRTTGPLLACLSVLACCTIAFGAPLKVAVYSEGLGGNAVAEALAENPDIETAMVSGLAADALLGHDVVFVGSTGLDRPEYVQGLQVFVGAGGGLVLNHAACGRHRPETLYPGIAKRVSGRREDTVVQVARDHPITKELPAEFEHAYYDHLLLEPGEDGEVVIRDREGDPVSVVGTVGKGRVVLNGTIPGFHYDPATYKQGEKPPEGAELQLVINMLKWAGQGRLSQKPEEQIEKARQETKQRLELEQMRELLPDSDWFGPEMLRGSYMARRPVGEMGGRFFITYDWMTWRGYDMRRASTEQQLEFFRRRLRIDVLQLKWLGVTDIIYWVDASGEEVYHNTDVPDSRTRYPHFDPLGMLVEVADEEGMKVWAAWHSTAESEEFAEKYCAKDADGNLYMYGGRDYCEDVLSPAWRERCHALIDEYAERYGDSDSFQGIGAYDELWFTYADFHGDDLQAFAEFCRDRFGDSPPANMSERLEKGRKWQDTDDVWRRRYILFKQHAITDYVEDLIDYCHDRGMKFGLELISTAHYSSGWCWGMDSVELARLGADYFITSAGTSAASHYDNTCGGRMPTTAGDTTTPTASVRLRGAPTSPSTNCGT